MQTESSSGLTVTSVRHLLINALCVIAGLAVGDVLLFVQPDTGDGGMAVLLGENNSNAGRVMGSKIIAVHHH